MAIATKALANGMTSALDGTATILTRDANRVALLRYGLRAAAHRICSECERLLEHLYQPERKAWRDAVGDALVASRHVLSLVPVMDGAAGIEDPSAFLRALAKQVEEPRRRIVEAMGGILRTVAVRPEEELLQRDARSLRELAVELLAIDRDESGAPDGSGANLNARTTVLPSRQPRVLIVDDEKLLRTILQRQLTALGCSVLLAQDGSAAAQLLERDAFDLILTDINMPKVDGLELLRLAKSKPTTRDIPVIVVSSLDDLSSVAKCIELGAEDHIAKPFEPVILQARVTASLERKRMRDVELAYLRDVAELTSAAEAVERDCFQPGSLATLVGRDDGLGQLARVFERIVSGLRLREERLQRRLHQLRSEVGNASSHPSASADVSAESPFASGEILAARYEIVGELGKGGMGMVYQARDLELHEEIAVKVVRRDLIGGDPTLLERLKSEIRLARRISHRNVVRSHDLGESHGTYFITMELVKGITLAELLDRKGRLTIESTLGIGTQLADALAVAHEQQIIHRDIKPANLLIDEGGVLKVMDFGLARLVERDINLTQGGFIVGTPQYMSPEQLMGGTVDARSDLFAVGVALYECLAGRPPFLADSPLALSALILEEDYPPVEKLALDIPPQLAAIIRQLLRPLPENRIPSACELADKLSEIGHSTAT